MRVALPVDCLSQPGWQKIPADLVGFSVRDGLAMGGFIGE